MKFKIIGDKEQIKKHIDEFITLSKREWDSQFKKFERFGVKQVFEMGYVDEDDGVMLINSIKTPLIFRFGRAKKKMENNLKGYFRIKGVDVEVKFLGD